MTINEVIRRLKALTEKRGPRGGVLAVNEQGTIVARGQKAKDLLAAQGKSGSKVKTEPKGRAKAAEKPGKKAKPSVADSVQTIRQLAEMGGPKAQAKLEEIIASHTVSEIGDLKKLLGIKASGTKAVLVAKVAERALATMGKPAKAKPKAEAKPKPKAPPKAKPAAKPAESPAPEPRPAARQASDPLATLPRKNRDILSQATVELPAQYNDMKTEVHRAIEELSTYRDFQNGIVPMYRVYYELQNKYPKLSVQEFHQALADMNANDDIERHVLNEVRDAVETPLAQYENERLYYYLMIPQDSRSDPKFQRGDSGDYSKKRQVFRLDQGVTRSGFAPEETGKA